MCFLFQLIQTTSNIESFLLHLLKTYIYGLNPSLAERIWKKKYKSAAHTKLILEQSMLPGQHFFYHSFFVQTG